MIIVQVITQTISTWRQYLQDGNQIAQIVGTIMVVIYVIYTYKTFRQIRKQTDYQQDAYLRMDTTILNELIEKKEGQPFTISDGKIVMRGASLPVKYISKDLPLKMKGILKPIFNFEDNLFEGNYFTVVMTNYGNAEVNKITLHLVIEIRNSKELVDKRMLREIEKQVIEVDLDEIITRNGGQLKIPLLSTASFPYYDITLSGSYSDVRNKNYSLNTKTTSGQNPHFHKLIES